MNTWAGNLVCKLCGDKAHPTYPVIDGKPLGVICGRCDFRMTPTIEEWEQLNGAWASNIKRWAEVLGGSNDCISKVLL